MVKLELVEGQEHSMVILEFEEKPSTDTEYFAEPIISSPRSIT